MSRPLRIEFPGAWYHVMNRGRRREDIFLSLHDYEMFLQVLQEASDLWNLKVAAYCLMSNHYHLLLHTPDGNISRCMRHVSGVYTQRFNRYHGEDGQLFRGRYKAVLVDADNYLLEVMRYIHRNPLSAGITDSLDNYEWSSHHGYLSRARKWEWLHKEFLMFMLSTRQSKGRSVYIDFVSFGTPENINRFYALKNLPSILGEDSFKEWISKKFGKLKFNREIPASRELRITPAKIIDVVCDYFLLDRKKLCCSKRGTENLPRDIAIYLVRHHCGETLAGVGSYFGIENYSTVSSVVERVKERKNNDKSTQKHLRKIEGLLVKSHRQT